MGNLVKMDFYRMFRSKAFIISNIIIFISGILGKVAELLLYNLSVQMAKESEEMAASITEYSYTADLSDIFINPFWISMLLIVVLVSAVSFSYADIANGFIKNIAGQVKKKGHTVISKFIVLCVHNLIFFCVAALGRIAGQFVIGGNFKIDAADMPIGIGTFICKWLLLQALCTIILFISTGLKNKTLASVVGVILGSGSLMILHLMIDGRVKQFVDINLSDFDPSVLIQGSAGFMFANAIGVSLVVIAIFLSLTVSIFNKSDVK